MRFLIEAFDKKTDIQAFVIELPAGRDHHIKTIMGWSKEQQGWEGYDLTTQQIEAIEKLMGRSIVHQDFYLQLTCNV